MGLSILFYNTGIRLYRFSLGLAAKLGGNKKAQLWLAGRESMWPGLEAAMKGDVPVVWIHAASLGEFEQGRPVLEELRQQYPGHRILLTFFSPSGYEVRKDYKGADYVCYLPLDTPENARRFLSTVQPSLAIFIKYEFWYHYLSGLKARNVPVLLISGIFRRKQIFFKWYGGLFRKLLRGMDQLFVQNEVSLTLLHNIGIRQVMLAGDTRFDRVWALREDPVVLPEIERFIKVPKVMVAGSTWEEDEKLLAEWWYGGAQDIRQMILAPHEITEARLKGIEQLFPDAIRYSAFVNGEVPKGKVLIIDNVGMLSALYRYSRVSYVGGGFGKAGIHNILEPATYAKPVIIGPVYQQFDEAVSLVQLRGAIVVANLNDLNRAIEALNDPYYHQQITEIASRFVEEHQGATNKIIHFIQEKRFLTRE